MHGVMVSRWYWRKPDGWLVSLTGRELAAGHTVTHPLPRSA